MSDRIAGVTWIALFMLLLAIAYAGRQREAGPCVESVVETKYGECPAGTEARNVDEFSGATLCACGKGE